MSSTWAMTQALQGGELRLVLVALPQGLTDTFTQGQATLSGQDVHGLPAVIGAGLHLICKGWGTAQVRPVGQQAWHLPSFLYRGSHQGPAHSQTHSFPSGYECSLYHEIPQ